MSTAHERFYGGSEEITITTTPGNYQLAPGGPRVIVVSTISGGSPELPGFLQLPDARMLRVGGPQFYFLNNDGAGEGLLPEDASGSHSWVVGITARQGSVFTLLKNDTLAGEWLQSYFQDIPFL